MEVTFLVLLEKKALQQKNEVMSKMSTSFLNEMSHFIAILLFKITRTSCLSNQGVVQATIHENATEKITVFWQHRQLTKLSMHTESREVFFFFFFYLASEEKALKTLLCNALFAHTETNEIFIFFYIYNLIIMFLL